MSWFLILPFPILAFSIMVNGTSSVFSCVMTITAIYFLYEIGYIYNDAETIKTEKEPTLRLRADELEYYKKHKISIYLSRFFVASILILMTCFEVESLIPMLVFLITPTFHLYNHIRNNGTLILHFVLVTLRFSLPFYIISGSVIAFSASLLLFPVINIMERSSEKKFKLEIAQKNILGNCKSGRYIYYALSTIVLGIVWNFDVLIPYIFVLSLYFFVYRLLTNKITK